MDSGEAGGVRSFAFEHFIKVFFSDAPGGADWAGAVGIGGFGVGGVFAFCDVNHFLILLLVYKSLYTSLVYILI